MAKKKGVRTPIPITSLHWTERARQTKDEHDHNYQAVLDVYYETRNDAQDGKISAARLCVTEYSIEQQEPDTDDYDYANEVSGVVLWLEPGGVMMEVGDESSWTIMKRWRNLCFLGSRS